MWTQQETSRALRVWSMMCLCTQVSAFLSTTPGSPAASHIVTARPLQPDHFGGGGNEMNRAQFYDRYEEGPGRGENMMDINAEAGGSMTFNRGDENAPAVRMDASAPRTRNGPHSTVQGAGSRATWVSPDPYGYDEMNVHLGTEGRPLYANVEHWSGPGNTPSRMQLYSEDGGALPWRTKFSTPNNVASGVTQVRNIGPMEFPLEAQVTGSNQGGHESSGVAMPTGNQMTPPKTIDGGALKVFGFDHDVQNVYLEISSEGMPVNARVELWQGPSNTKAIGKIYTDHGAQRPWSALIPLPGHGGSICVINEGPMEYPIKVRMDPPPLSMM